MSDNPTCTQLSFIKSGKTYDIRDADAQAKLTTKADKATTLAGYGITDAATSSSLDAHTSDNTIHVTSSDKTTWSNKQDALVSGINIKTINNESILDEGNISVATASQGEKADTAVQPSDLAAVATSGSYNDLTNKPTIPASQVNSDWNADSGVAQILNKPTINSIELSGNKTSSDLGLLGENDLLPVTNRVDFLEEQLYDTIPYHEDIVCYNKLYTNHNNGSTFSGIAGSIGRPEKISWAEVYVYIYADTPVTELTCNLFKISRDITDDDFKVNAETGARTGPYIVPLLTKVSTVTKTWDEPLEMEKLHTIHVDFPEVIDNSEGLQYILEYYTNNISRCYFCISQTAPSPWGTGHGPWINYNTWNAKTGKHGTLIEQLAQTAAFNQSGGAWTQESNGKYYCAAAKVGWHKTWTEDKISTDKDGNFGTLTQGVLNDLQLIEKVESADAATHLVQKVTLPAYQGYSPIDLTTDTTNITWYNPNSIFSGETHVIGPVPAEVPIQGFRVPFRVREGGGKTTATQARVILYSGDDYCTSQTGATQSGTPWKDLNMVLERKKVIDINLDTEGTDRGIFDFYFDEPFYNTNNKILYLDITLSWYFYRCYLAAGTSEHPAVENTFINKLYGTNFGKPVEEGDPGYLACFYTTPVTGISDLNDERTITHAPAWSGATLYIPAFSIITPQDTYLPSNLFNEWVDDRTSTSITTAINEYMEENLKKSEVTLAKEYTAVVGDTLRIYYDGAIKGVNPSNTMDIAVKCAKGKQYPRFWEYTPTLEDVGTYTFKLTVRKDIEGNVESEGTTTIRVVPVPTCESAKTVNILCLGDSLTSDGCWCSEGIRRLVGTADSGYTGPASNKVANLTLSSYGKMNRTNNTQKVYYEGYGGWTWASFLGHTGDTSTTNGIYVTLNHSIDWDLNTVQHSIWVDQNSKNWVLEDIDHENNKIKFDRGSGNNARQSATPVPTQLTCGTLSLSIASSEITTVTWEVGNPLWDETTNRVNFIAHAQKLDHAPADIVATLLTWNAGIGAASIQAHMLNAATLIRDIHADLPNAKVICLGLQIPSITGGTGANYGANGGYADMMKTVYYAHDYNKALEDLVTSDEFKSYCYFVDTKAEFDTKYLMPYDNVNVNSRSTVKEMIGTNGVHPSVDGKYSIGDAFYRELCKVIPLVDNE